MYAPITDQYPYSHQVTKFL